MKRRTKWREYASASGLEHVTRLQTHELIVAEWVVVVVVVVVVLVVVRCVLIFLCVTIDNCRIRFKINTGEDEDLNLLKMVMEMERYMYAHFSLFLLFSMNSNGYQFTSSANVFQRKYMKPGQRRMIATCCDHVFTGLTHFLWTLLKQRAYFYLSIFLSIHPISGS